jgi:GDP-L-fucose synthase
VVYLAAAKVGGIHANYTYPAEFIYQNLMIQNNVIHHAFLNGVRRLLFLGSSCIYPKFAVQPLREDSLLTGSLEPTNEAYAIAKIAGIKMVESYNRQYGEKYGIDYRSLMPTNLYGPGDNYHPENSHVIPALIQRIHNAKVNNLNNVTIWGSGRPRREFLFVDDMARASILFMNLAFKSIENINGSKSFFINAGFGSDISIADLALLIKEVIEYQGEIIFDTTKQDGIEKKLLDITHLSNIGFRPSVGLKEGIKLAYESFLTDTFK